MFRKNYFIFAFLFFILIISRFILLDRSARFIWDESDDLVRMHDIYVNHRITMVGPIAEDNTKLFGSLSYYMLMPFAIAYNFNPVGNVVGTAFYGTLTALGLMYLLRKHLKVPTLVAVIIPIVLFPLVQSSRWAWNPHFIPFWELLVLLILYRWHKKWYAWPLAGLLQGLTIHNHWFGIFASVGLMAALFFVRKVKKKELVLFIAGFILSLVPFVVFDITHPPGLFFTRLFYFSPLTAAKTPFSIGSVITYIFSGTVGFFQYLIPNMWLAATFTLFFVIYLFKTIKHKSPGVLFIIPVVAQIVGLALLRQEPYTHYLLPVIVYFVLFLLYPSKAKKLQWLLIGILIIGSIIASTHEILKNDWSTNIKRTLHITDILEKNMTDNCNVFAGASPDPSTQGIKYRNLLQLRGKSFLSKLNYDTNNCLFVISTSGEAKIQKDPAYELNHIRGRKAVEVWTVEDGWKVYLYKY